MRLQLSTRSVEGNTIPYKILKNLQVFGDVTHLFHLKLVINKVINMATKSSNASTASNGNRRVYVMRHGERVDYNFHNWVSECFDESGNYQRDDLNMPKTLPKRANAKWSWDRDTPLTNIGLHQARLTGEALLEERVKIDHIYSSPAYRSIQTAASVLEGLQLSDKLKIKVEPALFEWMSWYGKRSEQEYLSQSELLAAKFNIDTNYQAMTSISQLNECDAESTTDFYRRNHECLCKILKQTTGNILLVAHGITLDSCTRLLTGGLARDYKSLFQVVRAVPFCGVSSIEQSNDGKSWELVTPECLPLTHSKNVYFNWTSLRHSDMPTLPGSKSRSVLQEKLQDWVTKNPQITEEKKEQNK